jgi:hypothetical protein
MVRRFVIALLALALVLTLAGTAGAQTQEPTLNFTVDPVGTFNPTTGVATITGTYSCTNASQFVLFGTVHQSVGHFTIVGGSASFGSCGPSQSWSISVAPENRGFVGGRASMRAMAASCQAAFHPPCALVFLEQTVMLRGGPTSA